jgi:hypothetical protein
MPGPRDSGELQAIEERLALEMAGHGADIVLVVTATTPASSSATGRPMSGLKIFR